MLPEPDSIIAFMSANPDLMCIADSKGRFVKVSQAWEEVMGYAVDELDGQPYLSFVHPEDVERTRLEMLRFFREGHQDQYVNRYRRKDGSYVSLEWHSHLVNGLVYASARDVTARLEEDNRTRHALAMKEAHVALMQSGIEDADTFLGRMLELAIAFTSSQIGYVFLFDEQTQSLTLQSWSREVMSVCAIPDRRVAYRLEETGLWGEVVRRREPVIVNDYKLPHPAKRGFPEGHAPIHNFLSIPVIWDNRVVALLGVANRQGDYAKQHVLDLTLLTNTVWPVVEGIRVRTDLQAKQELLSTTLSTLQEAILVTDVQGRITHMNRVAEKYGGISLAEALGMPYVDVFHPYDPDTGREREDPVRRIFQEDSPRLAERDLGLRGRDGTERRVSATAIPFMGADGQTHGVVIGFRDRTLELQQQRELDDVLELSPDPFCVLGADGLFQKVNPRFEDLLGYKAEQLAGHHIMDFVHEQDHAGVLKAIARLREQQTVSGLINRFRDGKGVYHTLEWTARPIAGRYVYATARDVTEARKKEQALRASVVRDRLTGCYNRVFLEAMGDELMMRSERYGETFSVILLDLDHFKRVNDTWGHPVGDDVLKRTARLLQRSIRAADSLVRYGGEEFLVLLPQTGSSAIRAAEKLRAVLEANPHPQTGLQTASFGVASKEIGETFESLIRRADEAMYQAKQAGRNCVWAAASPPADRQASGSILWKPEWACGDPLIDAQHQQLVKYGNELLGALSRRRPGKAMEANIRMRRLLAHIQRHFSDEEQLMRQIAYPEADRHAIAHQNLINRAEVLLSDPKPRQNRFAAVLTFLVDELIVEHMQAWDTLFYPYLKKRKRLHGKSGAQP